MVNLKTINTICCILGILSVVSYITHVIVGHKNYPHYKWMEQAISDLTAKNAPSRKMASIFSSLYGVMSCLFALFLTIGNFRNINTCFDVAAVTLTVMFFISAMGYTLFPLDKASESDKSIEGTFSNVMHLVVTFAVVILTIASLIVFAIAFFKSSSTPWHVFMGVLSLVCLVFMALGGILTNVVPKSYFGVVERFSIYALLVYILAFSVWALVIV